MPVIQECPFKTNKQNIFYIQNPFVTCLSNYLLKNELSTREVLLKFLVVGTSLC